VCLRTARFEIFKTLYQCLIAPFGTVRFRDFFLADIVTSMGTPLADIGVIIMYFSQGKWLHRDPEVAAPLIYLAVVAYLPYWWRFWQCLNKWKTQDSPMQAVNALKYLSKFGPPTAALLGCAKHPGDPSAWVYFGA
jgi:hypothetical protein